MDLGGKIVDRFRIPRQIGTTEPMGEEIRASSVIDGRGIEDQIRFLLRMGLEYRRYQIGQGHPAQSTHTSAPLHTEAKKPPTRSRTSAHFDTQRRTA